MAKNIKYIRIDAGGIMLNQSGFGTETVTQELLRALLKQDKRNKYEIYTRINLKGCKYCKNTIFTHIKPNRGWMKLGITLREAQYILKSGVFLALQQALPLYTPSPIIGFSHGISFIKYPHLYPDSAEKMKHQLKLLLNKSRFIIVSSIKIKKEINALFKKHNTQIKVINFGVPEAYIKKSKKFKRKKIILFVGINHAIKNIPLLLDAFLILKTKKEFFNYKLVLAGVSSLPQKYYNSIYSNDILPIGHVGQENLLKLYNECFCLVVTSLYESFHLPTIEALAQQTPVVSVKNAVIPELSKYVIQTKMNPESIVQAIENVYFNPPYINQNQIVNKFSWQNFANQLISLYEKI